MSDFDTLNNILQRSVAKLGEICSNAHFFRESGAKEKATLHDALGALHGIVVDQQMRIEKLEARAKAKKGSSRPTKGRA